MFADDVGLLPDHMFTRMLEQAHRAPAHLADLAGDLFRVMARGGRVGFETVDWFNGGLFDDDTALPLEKSDIDTVLAASNLDWSEIDPSILGTLFERGLDPGKRAQLGAHYTDRDKIMLIVEPVVIRPWLAEWAAEKAEIAAELERAEAAKSPAARTKRRNEAERGYRAFLNRLRAFTVLDPACGSGNFLGLALQALKDLEHRVQFEAEALSFQRAFPEIGPANVKGIEINPYAAELARVSVWIGEIPVDAAQRILGGPQPDPAAARHHRVPGCDRDAGQRRTGSARGRRRDREPTVPGRQAPDHAPRRRLRVADVQDLCRARSGGSGSGLLLVREGRPADRRGQGAAGRTRRNELDPRRREPPGSGGRNPQVPAKFERKPIWSTDRHKSAGHWVEASASSSCSAAAASVL